MPEEPLADTSVCPECETEFDWPGVEVEGEIYCCEPCSRGELCVCSQHNHDPLDTDVPTPTVPGEPGPL
jgi:hypothetical protein